MSLENFTRQYVETLLWSTTDESTPQGGEPMDKNYSAADFAPDAMERIKTDCAKFYAEQSSKWEALELSPFAPAADDIDESAGHDFWLTRNGHGAGFWDGDWPDPLGDELTTASKAFGECNPYIGDDGMIYLD